MEKAVGGAALAGAAVLPAFYQAEAARGRGVSKAAAHYQYRPHRGQHCGICEHFRPPQSCEIVRGRIVPNGWCRYFEARGGDRSGRPRSGGGY